MSSFVEPQPDVITSPGRARGRIPAWCSGLWRAWSEADPPQTVKRSDWPTPLRLAWFAGLVLLGVQVIGLGAWGSILNARWSLQEDFATHQQAAYLIAHGVLDPYSTVQHFFYWQDHDELIFWLMAPFQALGVHSVLMWLQAAAAVGAEAVAFRWICDLIASQPSLTADHRRAGAGLALLGSLLLVANPWTYWALSFDVHVEPFAMLFGVGAARALYQGRRSVWIWLILGLLVGDVAASYFGAIGLSAALSARWRCKRGLIVAAAAFGWLFVIQAVGGNHGDAFRQFKYLVNTRPGLTPKKITAVSVISGMVAHPNRPVTALWANRANLWANVSPSGALGVVWLPVLVPTVLLMAESQLGGNASDGFSQPGFQNILLVCLGAVGTIALLIRLVAGPRGRWKLMCALAVLVAANAVVWATLWLPQVPNRWLRVSPAAAHALSEVQRQVRPDDEVIAQNGIIGGFSNRKYLYQANASSTASFALKARRVWFVLAPNQGIEVLSPAGAHQFLSEVGALPYAHLVVAHSGVYAFLLTPPRGVTQIALHPVADTAAWSFAGVAGEPITSGPSSDWFVAGNGLSGYVLDHAYWREGPGTYEAHVRLSSTGPADIEIWNSTTNKLLSRQVHGTTDGEAEITIAATIRHTRPESVFAGSGIWSTYVAPPKRDNLEVRVWSPGGNDVVDVYKVSMHRIGPR